jgi:hypothetical protein
MRRLSVYPRHLGPILAGALIVALTGTSRAREQASDADVSTARTQLYSTYSTELGKLAAWCDSAGLARQADLTRKWLPRREPMMIYVFALADTSDPPSGLADSDSAKQWWQRFIELRRAQADKLFELASVASKSHQEDVALELARETVRENPDHDAARHVLGHKRYGQRWVTPAAARRLDAGQVWTERFGWLPSEQAARYEQGQRFYRGQWLSPAEDARLRSNIYNGWHVESDHYLVVTNVGLEEGAKLARRLETLYEAWRQAFVRYYAKPAEIQSWFAAASGPQAAGFASAREPAHPLQVVYFHDKSQYVDALKAVQPLIEMSLGFYSASNKSAYFFAGDEQYDGTLNHEATHQLFQEWHTAIPDPGRKNNFWVYEAVACYMESLEEHRLLEGEPHGSFVTLGGENAGRVPAARKRLLDDGFYVPLRELAAMGREGFQQDPRVSAVYSQISGQAQFLMHADAARYRPALMDYLTALYSGHASPNTLEKLTSAKFEDLDRQYRDFMK